MNKNQLEEEIKEIVKDAIEGQMDWEAYYEGSYEEPTNAILSLFTKRQEEVVGELKREKVDIRPEISEWLISKNRDEAEGFNKAIDKAISIVKKV